MRPSRIIVGEVRAEECLDCCSRSTPVFPRSTRSVIDRQTARPGDNAEVSDHSSTPSAQAALFMEHARWVMEWHNKRAEGAATRAVAVLGFAGVTMALLVQGASLDGLEPTGWTWLFAGLGAALLDTGLPLRATCHQHEEGADA